MAEKEVMVEKEGTKETQTDEISVVQLAGEEEVQKVKVELQKATEETEVGMDF